MGEKKPDRSAVPDAEIIQLVLGGEIDAFDELVRRTRRPAYRLARRITRNHEDADDVVQDSYVKAYRALARFEAGRAFGPWFLTIVARSALSQIRQRTRRASVPLDEPGADGTTLADKIPDAAMDVVGMQRLLDVEEALERLTDEQRAILALRVDGDLPYAEIATALDVPVGTVMSRLARAREALLEEVEKLRAARFSR
ncbi:MAG TPA: RNA polymerase sigma factor [Candidatus Limnocylindrales bacterium]|nr:RNA polymerase sigma factor [Candidatus Limnocylindrales bacterium]